MLLKMGAFRILIGTAFQIFGHYSKYKIDNFLSACYTHAWEATYKGRGGALVETMTFNRRVVGSTPTLAAT